MQKMRIFYKILFSCVWCMIFPFVVWADAGTYYGTASITAPANLGTIDLAFNLDISGTNIQHDTSYILLDTTLLFPAVMPKLLISKGVPVVSNGVLVSCTIEPNCVEVGPRVAANSTLTPTSLSLTTDSFPCTVSNKLVTRKVMLNSTLIANNGASITGAYTETISGLTPEVVTVTGSFILVKPTVQTIVVTLKDLNSDGCLDLNEIRAAGTNANIVEFNDISQALQLYYNATQTPNLCAPKEQTLKDALNEFYATQKQ
jgi:hypothetical protein